MYILICKFQKLKTSCSFFLCVQSKIACNKTLSRTFFLIILDLRSRLPFLAALVMHILRSSVFAKHLLVAMMLEQLEFYLCNCTVNH